MESSRSGPLANLILVLPLIVVPALVVLRPARHNTGLMNEDMAASEDSFPDDPDDFDAIFGTESPENPTNLRDSSRIAEPRSAPDGTSLRPDTIHESDTFHKSGSASAEHHHDRIPEDTSASPPAESRPHKQPNLSRYGVTSSVWFYPGHPEGHIGFAAFIPGVTTDVRYRFSAIGSTEEEVVQDVVEQIRSWRREQNAAERRTP